jgi:hypothetical protein
MRPASRRGFGNRKERWYSLLYAARLVQDLMLKANKPSHPPLVKGGLHGLTRRSDAADYFSSANGKAHATRNERPRGNLSHKSPVSIPHG